MRGGWHPGVIGIVAGRLKEKFAGPAIVIARERGRHRQGLGPFDLGRRPRRGGARGEGQRAADRRRRPRHGGGADRAAGRARSRSATSSTSGSPPTSRKRAATARCCSTRCWRPAGSPALFATRSTRPGPMAPAGRARGSPPGRCGWSRPASSATAMCAGSAAGDDGKSFKWIAFRSAAARSARRCSHRAADTRWWLAGTIKREAEGARQGPNVLGAAVEIGEVVLEDLDPGIAGLGGGGELVGQHARHADGGDPLIHRRHLPTAYIRCHGSPIALRHDPARGRRAWPRRITTASRQSRGRPPP